MNGKRLLVLFYANDNHLSNVRTLQSLYKQDYPNIFLIVCNDCTDQFQSERLLYNFQAGKPDGIRQIVFHENPYPLGEYQSQTQFWKAFDAEYIFTIHAGEYLCSNDTLTKCVGQLESNGSITAVVTSSELWSDDLKKKLASQPAAQKAGFLTEECVEISKLRDCMLICRLEAVKKLDLQKTNKQTVGQAVLTALLTDKDLVLALPFPACRYSNASIKIPQVLLSQTYGNENLEQITALLESSPKGQKVFPDTEKLPTKREHKRKSLLYRYSRRKLFKWYMAIMLLLFTCAGILTSGENHTRFFSAGVLIVTACIVLVWMLAMLLTNIYFKKNPQRLGL